MPLRGLDVDALLAEALDHRRFAADQRPEVLERRPEQGRLVDAPDVELPRRDVAERRPQVDAEAGRDARRHVDVDRFGADRVRVPGALEDRQDARGDVRPRGERVEPGDQPVQVRASERRPGASTTSLVLAMGAALALGGLGRLHGGPC
jgi:hypothetical protein